MTLGKQIRILILLIFLFLAIVYTKAQGHFSTNWEKPLEVIIYPVNITQDEETTKYIASLNNDDFRLIDEFTSKEARHWNVELLNPTQTRLGKEISKIPPHPPSANANVLSIMLWSLQFRYWAWVHTRGEDVSFLTVRMFVLYQHAEKGEAVDHSFGLSKGLLAYVNAFASEGQTEQNNIVIAHELLHTVGAVDKYGAGGEPLFPQGYAEPKRSSYPQRQAEIMAGRTPISSTESYMPEDLRSVVVGEQTAKEINWLENDEE